MTRRRQKALGIPATLALIASAFVNDKLDAVASFPLGTTYLERDEIVGSTHKKKWSEVGWEALERNHESPHFATPAGLAAYLPAYLTVVVRDFDRLDMLPTMVCGALTKQETRQRHLLLFV